MSCASCSSGASPSATDAAGPTFECPARMSDGRSFTDYRSSKCSIFSTIPYGKSSFTSRQYMIENADDIIRRQRAAASNGMCPCPPNPVPVPGEQWVVRCTPQTCTRTPDDATGLGDGRRYS